MNEKGTSPESYRPREENKGYYENKSYTKEFVNLDEKNNLFLRAQHKMLAWRKIEIALYLLKC